MKQVEWVILISTFKDITLLLFNTLNSQFDIQGQFLIDTGAEGNIVKKCILPEDCIIDQSKALLIQGIGDTFVPTLGTTTTEILGHTTDFQAVPDDFAIPSEGILGIEYFESAAANIDFG